MKSLLLLPLFICASLFATAQVGIRTAQPKADLDIVSNPSPGIDNYNGIIIPKVTVLPLSGAAEFPKPAQAGLLIYLNSGDATKGIYIFDGTKYIKLEPAAAAGAFYNNGTTDFATTTTANIERSGNISIGSGLNSGKLNVNVVSANSSADPIGIKVENNNTGTGATNNYGVFIENKSTVAAPGVKYGLRADVSSSGDSDRVGIQNNVSSSGGSDTRGVIGIENKVGATSGASSINVGIRSEIGTGLSDANSFGILSIARGSDTKNNYSGYFQGDKFAISNEDNTNAYELPTTTGTAGQVLTVTTTNLVAGKTTGIVQWQNIPQGGSLSVLPGGANDSQIQSNTSGSTDVTITGGNNISVTESNSTITIQAASTFNHTVINAGTGTAYTQIGPVTISQGSYISINPGTAGLNNYVLPDPTLVLGRQYIIRNVNNTNNGYLVALNSSSTTKLFFEGNSDIGVQYYEVDAIGNSKTITVISDGTNYTVIRDL
jgi:hypothetical protein